MLSTEQLRLANEAIDGMQPLTASPTYSGTSVAMKGSSTRLGNKGGLLELPQPHCQPFREVCNAT